MDRKNFIGGSDAVKIMDAEWYELWQVKMGLKEPEDLSSILAVQLGVHTEEFNLRWFEENTLFQCITQCSTHHCPKVQKPARGRGAAQASRAPGLRTLPESLCKIRYHTDMDPPESDLRLLNPLYIIVA